MNTIDDMQNEKDFFYHCNEFEYIHDFVIFFNQYSSQRFCDIIQSIFFSKTVYNTLGYEVLDSDECLYEKDNYKFLF